MQRHAAKAGGGGDAGRSRRRVLAGVPTSFTLGVAALLALLIYRRRGRGLGVEGGSLDTWAPAAAPISDGPAVVSPPDDAVSPELALIDSSIRDRLVRDQSAPPGAPSPSSPPEAPARRRNAARRRPRIWVVTAVVLVGGAVAAGAVLRGASLRSGSSPGSPADHARPAVASTASPARDFVWAPVRGAAGYDLEIRRGGKVVYAVTTPVPRVRVPSEWERGGRTLELSAGVYSWYVWPIPSAGARRQRGPAVVASTFVVR